MNLSVVAVCHSVLFSLFCAVGDLAFCLNDGVARFVVLIGHVYA